MQQEQNIQEARKWSSKHRWRHDANSGQDESQGGLSQPQLSVD